MLCVLRHCTPPFLLCIIYSVSDITTVNALVTPENIDQTTDNGLSLLHIRCMSGGKLLALNAVYILCLWCCIPRFTSSAQLYMGSGCLNEFSTCICSAPCLCFTPHFLKSLIGVRLLDRYPPHNCHGFKQGHPL